MTTLTLTTDTNFGVQALSNIDTVNFNFNFLNPDSFIVATFLAAQFSNGDILSNVTFDSSIVTDSIVVNGGSLSAANWNFVAWSASDTITLNGSAASDSITGSSEADSIFGLGSADSLNGGDGDDTIDGGAGNDSLRGGLGLDTLLGGNDDDTFFFGDAAEVGVGEIVDGGGGTGDAINIVTSSTVAVDFSDATLLNLEALIFTGVGRAFFLDTQLGNAAGRITSVTGGAGENAVIMDGSAVDLRNVTFANWAAEDFITIFGTGGNDILRGSVKSDRFDDPDGLDQLFGNGGNDRFNLDITNNQAGTLIDGGGGVADRLVLQSANDYDLRQLSIVRVENLFLESLPAGRTVDLLASQIGGVGDFTTIEKAVAAGVVTLRLAPANAADLSTVNFINFTVSDVVEITGTAAANALSGSSVDDEINGNAGGDNIKGNAGNDVLFGGTGADTIDGGNNNDIINGGRGKDILTGGAGFDSFDYNEVQDSLPGGNRDIITDFEQGIDKIDLIGIDADISTGADEDFKLITGALGTNPGEIRVVQNVASGITIISGSIDADSTAEFQIELTGLFTLTVADFFL